MSVITICKTAEEMDLFQNQPAAKHINSSTMPMLSEKATFVAMPSTSSIQSSQILLINNVEGQPVSGIFLPPNNFMLKLNQNQVQSESDPDSDRESTSKFFSMTKSEKQEFRETFFCTLLDFMHEIVKDGHIVSSSDPIWKRVASKLDNIIKPKSIYNRFILDIHLCRTRLFEEYLKAPKSPITDTSAFNEPQKIEMQYEKIEKIPVHVDNKTFYEALFAFKDKIFNDGKIASSVDLVWSQISAHLNYALKPNSIYLRFKRNTDKFYKKLLTHCRFDPSKAKTYDVSSVKMPINKVKKKNLKFKDSSKFFEALYTHRQKIIQNGLIARYDDSIWNDVAKTLDYALQPSDVYSKFIRNHDLCQTKLIETCKKDENFIPLVIPKFDKPNCVSDDMFFSVLCKYRDDILQNGNQLAKFSHPVWTQISKDLNEALKPATVYFRVTRNSQLCLNRLFNPSELLTDYIHNENVSKDNFIETICLYKYSIMNGDQVVDLSDPVWNEISLRLNSTLTPEAIFDSVSQDKDLCKTKMIQALKTECYVFSGESSEEVSENISELTPIVECNVSNEPTDSFNEILNEFKTSIIQPNGQMALKDDPVWKQISYRLKGLKSDEVYLRILNNYKNCQKQLYSVNSVDKDKFFEALFKYRRSVIYNNTCIANVNNKVWTKISEELNYALTQTEIHRRFINDENRCRTNLLKSLKTTSQHRKIIDKNIDKNMFLDAIISHKDNIVKNGSHAKFGDPVWKEIAIKLNFKLQPLAIYNNFVTNRFNCKQKLLEACDLSKTNLNSSLISSKITAQMDHDYTKGGTDNSFENVMSIRQKGYVHENDFIKACFMFKDRLVKYDRIVSPTNLVWKDISKHLNNAIKPKTAYLRFKRNTHNCQEKLFGKLKEHSYEKDDESFSAEDYKIENELYFDAISIFKHSIINNGDFALESSPVWLDISNAMNSLLTPEEAFCKFRQNIDLCRTKLINNWIIDWSKESPTVKQNRIHLIKSKVSSWDENLSLEQVTKTNQMSHIKPFIDDAEFYDAIYKYKSQIFLNDLVANCTNPVWVEIAKELNNVLDPLTIHSRFKNNMSKCNIKFSEAAQRHNFQKLKQKQLIDDNSEDSCDQNLVIDFEDEQIVECNTGN